MENTSNQYIGKGFLILCIAVLVGVVGIFGYHFTISQKNISISPAITDTNEIDVHNNID